MLLQNANVNPTSADRRSRIKVGPLTPEYIQSIYGFKVRGRGQLQPTTLDRTHARLQSCHLDAVLWNNYACT